LDSCGFTGCKLIAPTFLFVDLIEAPLAGRCEHRDNHHPHRYTFAGERGSFWSGIVSRIFLSHSSANNAEAIALRDWLANEG
jgi:hypothetical protein